MKRRTSAVLAAMLVVSIAILLACGGGSNQAGTANVTLSMSDPPTCSNTLSSGGYAHVYVTVADVQISTSANASPNDPGWVDLTPYLKGAPKQVDLLGTPTNCFLATFGTAGIPGGSYQQIRLILADNSVTPANGNACGKVANCVMTSSSPNTPQALQLSSETQTGIKIPTSQIAGGQFTVAAGQTKELNLDFDGCASVVAMGSGQYRLKPVVHGGEVQPSAAITGRLVDGLGTAITNANTIVALEQKDANGIDRVLMQTRPDVTGVFSLCPITGVGTFEIVVASINGSNVAFGPTVITGVPVGTSLGNITVNVVPGSGTAATINTQITSVGAGGAVGVDATVSALQQATLTSGGTPVWITVPLATMTTATLAVSTTTGGSCPGGTACAGYPTPLPLAVPAANFTVGTFSNGAISYAPVVAGSPAYRVEGTATSTSTHDPTCNVPTVDLPSVAPGSTSSALLQFTGCS